MILYFLGVRALLRDKDLKPKWKPSNFEQVKDIQIYFTKWENKPCLQF